jgi:hypothetical protein
MNRTSKRPSALVDGFLDSYVWWREACDDVRTAYRSWSESKPPQRGLRFATYQAALDREEVAARVHSHWAERLGAPAR